MNEQAPMNRAERRAQRRTKGGAEIDPMKLLKAILSLEHPLEQRKVWVALLSQYQRMNPEEAEALRGMAENAEEFQDLRKTLGD
jgi:hypothetical protein